MLWGCRLWGCRAVVPSGAGPAVARMLSDSPGVSADGDGDGMRMRRGLYGGGALVLRLRVGIRSGGRGCVLFCILGDLSGRLRGIGGKFIGGGRLLWL